MLTAGSVDLERLLKLRVVVGRIGEMDREKWWNTKGQLGSLGAATLRRGLPRTHYFAQARSVFAVAAQRCAEVFDPPGSVTLWHLPEDVEEQFDARWELWLDNAADWTPFFTQVAALEAGAGGPRCDDPVCDAVDRAEGRARDGVWRPA